MANCKRIFIAATKQNDGKTTLSLGLISLFKKHFKRIGFIKPVGQRYLLEDGFKVDEDSVLIDRICGLCGIDYNILDTSPIAVERGFTQKYILKPTPESLKQKILKSFEKISQDKDIVIIEGTGHAGVGSVFDLSNAYVAKLIGSKVLLISSGGIGRPIDEIILNKAFFEKEKVELIGVIINKVKQDKYKKVNRLVRLGLKRKNIDVLGVIPYKRMLTSPSIAQIIEELNFELLSGGENLNNFVYNIIVGAMEPHDALNYIKEQSLIITPGDREDIILTALSSHLLKKDKKEKIAGIILTGGIRPHPSIMEMVKATEIPVLLAKDDTYTVASKVHDLSVKLRPQDKQKAKIIINMIEKFVDINQILKNL